LDDDDDVDDDDDDHDYDDYMYDSLMITIIIMIMIGIYRLTQPGHPMVGRRSEHQPKGGDALWLGRKGRYGSCVGGR